MAFGQKDKPARKKPIPYRCKNCRKRTTSTNPKVAKELKLCPDCRAKKVKASNPLFSGQSSIRGKLSQIAKMMSDTKLVIVAMRVKSDKLEKNQASLKARIDKIEKELG